MKRTKRLLALVLAMMMAFAMLAMPAAAHGDEDEGIMPLGLEIPCPKPDCGQSLIQETIRLPGAIVKFTCPTCRYNHETPSVNVYTRAVCTSCPYATGLVFKYFEYSTRCTGINV